MTDVTSPVTLADLHNRFTPDDTISLLIHAASKAGKSTLTSTAPRPNPGLDAVGGWRFSRSIGFKGAQLRKQHWDPMQGPPPRYDGTWDVCIVTVRKWNTLIQTYGWLTQAPHDFVSIVFDSITEAQRRCKQNLVGTDAMKIQHWGQLLTLMDSLIRDFRDLVLLPSTSVRCVIFIAETTMDEGKWRPSMQGQIKRALPYWVDICGYLYVDQEVDTDGQPTVKVRRMLVTPHNLFEAGERVQGVLGDVVNDPSVSTMMDTIFGSRTIQASLKEVTS